MTHDEPERSLGREHERHSSLPSPKHFWHVELHGTQLCDKRNDMLLNYWLHKRYVNYKVCSNIATSRDFLQDELDSEMTAC